MTDEELEKRATDFATKNPRVGVFIAQVEAFIVGAKENGVGWHDLRKNPKDLPSANQEVCMCYVCHVDNKKHTVVGAYQQVGYHCRWHAPYNNVFDNEVIAWCDIPKFEE